MLQNADGLTCSNLQQQATSFGEQDYYYYTPSDVYSNNIDFGLLNRLTLHIISSTMQLFNTFSSFQNIEKIIVLALIREKWHE